MGDKITEYQKSNSWLQDIQVDAFLFRLRTMKRVIPALYEECGFEIHENGKQIRKVKSGFSPMFRSFVPTKFTYIPRANAYFCNACGWGHKATAVPDYPERFRCQA